MIFPIYPDLKEKTVKVTSKFVEKNIGNLTKSKDLKKYANIETEVVLSSSGNMIELWNKSQYEKIVTDSEADFSKMAEEVMGKINDKENE